MSRSLRRKVRVPAALALAFFLGLLAPIAAQATVWSFADPLYCGSPETGVYESFTYDGVVKHYEMSPYQHLNTFVTDTNGPYGGWYIKRTYSSISGTIDQGVSNDGGQIDGQNSNPWCKLWSL